MQLGNNLVNARKKNGFSQEEVAEKLKVSRQTISKWEQGETVPDIYQVKDLSIMYKVSLDELVDFDNDLQEIEKVIKNFDEKKIEKINWTTTWSKRYPVLATYHEKVDINKYQSEIKKLLNNLSLDYGYNKLDSMLVLKDILYHVWKNSDR